MPDCTPEHPITAGELRRLAETADGARSRDLVLIWDCDTKSYAIVASELAGANPKLLDIKTTERVPARTRVNGVQIHVNGLEPNTLTPEYDALFWSESSVEKFVIPYYSRMLEQADMIELWKAHLDEKVYAFGHVWPSRNIAVRDPRQNLGLAVRDESPGVAPKVKWTTFTDWIAGRRR